MPAPLALFAFNRPRHLENTIFALQRNTLSAETDVYAFSDGSRVASDESAIRRVRDILKSAQGFHKLEIIERPKNLGLAHSVIEGVTDILRRYPEVIVVEDDLLTAPDFLSYMNAGLGNYRDESGVFSLTGYSAPIMFPKDYPYDAYLFYRCCSWSWATWRNRWQTVDWAVSEYAAFEKDAAARQAFDRGGRDMSMMLEHQMMGRIDSWAIRWCYAHHVNNAFCVYPVRSRTNNMGMDGSGTHTRPTNRYMTPLSSGRETHKYLFPPVSQVNPVIVKRLYKFYSEGLWGDLKRFVKKAISLA